MDFLKKLFPMSFKKSSEVKDLVIRIIIYVVIGFVVGLVTGLIALLQIPALNLLLSFISSIVGAYTTAGIVLAILVHCNVIKLGDGNNTEE